MLPEGDHPALIAAAKSSYNVSVIPYVRGDHEGVERSLLDLAVQVNNHRASYSA
jgi:hypothetical protein